MDVVAAVIGLGIGGVYATDAQSYKEEKHRKIKVVSINGSSRKNGNTADMLNLVLGEVEKRDMKRRKSESRTCFLDKGRKNSTCGCKETMKRNANDVDNFLNANSPLFFSAASLGFVFAVRFPLNPLFTTFLRSSAQSLVFYSYFLIQINRIEDRLRLNKGK